MFLNGLFCLESFALAVVPVFVNAGAVLLPALLAGLVSALALLFKPRELFRVCKKKPYVPLIVVAGVWEVRLLRNRVSRPARHVR
jgi:hypothetical protein